MVELLVASRNTFNRRVFLSFFVKVLVLIFFYKGDFETKNRRRKGTRKALPYFYLTSFMFWIKVENEKRE